MSTNKQLPLCVERTFQPKTYDIDFAGHVSNIVYIRWLEDLRLLLLETYLPLDTLMEKGIAPVVMRTTIDYKKPVRLFDKVVGKMWAGDIGNVKGVLLAEFTVDGIAVATAEQIGIFVRLASGRPVPSPEVFRQHFEEYRKSVDNNK